MRTVAFSLAWGVLVSHVAGTGDEFEYKIDWDSPVNIFEQVRPQVKARLAGHFDKRQLPNLNLLPIDVSGKHEFVPPDLGAGDQRGPCPGLNALANHGYLPHDGIYSIFEAPFVKVFGMGLDFGILLAVQATVWTGALVSANPRFSIGGASAKVDNAFKNIFGLLGRPTGLDGSHNIIESDASNTRNDLYQDGTLGDNYRLQLQRWKDWYYMSNDLEGDYNIALMADRGKVGFQQSKKNNPYFWHGPYSGIIASAGVLTFPPAFLSNHSTGNAGGRLTKKLIQSFYGVHGTEPDFEYKEGWEQIPENWYRRPFDYTFVAFLIDLADVLLRHPELASIGGNTGTPNSFVGLDLSNIAGGAFNATNLLNPQQLVCLGLEVLKIASPSLLSSLYSSISKPLRLIEDAVSPISGKLNCPVVEDLTYQGMPFQDFVTKLFPGSKLGKLPI
ncbi:hypothetical protein QQS21_003126 [Conoideocrella luteorostrata]|uniref:Heme haloperoxidase family profile domain-containing protein n=1 Tax=Conoideocrella luteorostrata TaxID=1105319 RepID=A0AAJ0CWV0_9HYPO|nr:hypothetical protein QQS21_003126 [Conoideocrella luteorostrata]